MMQRIVFRADGNKYIGLGHVYRLLALVEMLNEEFDCVFVINKPDSTISKHISSLCKLVGLNNDYNYLTPDSSTNHYSIDFDLDGQVDNNDIVVIDGYHFKEDYQRALKHIGCKQIFIDDMLGHYPFADAIVNHAPGIMPESYSNKHAFLALGLEYAILRKPFFSPLIPHDFSNQTAFISLGGSDYFGHTLKICNAVLSTKMFTKLHVLYTDKYSTSLVNNLKEIEKTGLLQLHLNLSAQEIKELLDTCTHAFVSASTVLIESYSRGVKCLTGFYTQNQHLIYKGFIDHNLAIGMGDLNEINEKKIFELLHTTESIRSLETPIASTPNYINLFKSI
jgi:spore coat polysaccharide biosynthesis predicted glycosyltransferase SpsG